MHLETDGFFETDPLFSVAFFISIALFLENDFFSRRHGREPSNYFHLSSDNYLTSN